MNIKHLIVLVLCLFASLYASGQKDSLIFKNKDLIVGEIKSLNDGIVQIETPYSDSDFKIEWSGLKEVYTKTSFLIILDDGQRFNGLLSSIAGSDSVKIIHIDEQVKIVKLNDIVFLKGVKSKFWSRIDASIDVGVTLSKANNLRQYNMSTAIGYLADKWQLNVTYTDNRSKQDDIAQTRRTEENAEFKYFLQKNWFLNTSANFLSNTEQALKLRTTGKAGAGKFLVHSNKSYWGVGGGASFNFETFTNDTEARNSLEAYVGTELNIFDVKNLDLLTNISVYRSITESKRWRSDFKLDLKYKLPFDFYLKPSISANYDNRPAVAGNTTDYVFTFSFGWEP